LVPVPNPRKRAAVGLALLLAAGCGGGGGKAKERVVRGEGFTFAAPLGWMVDRRGGVIQVQNGTDLVSVTRYPLLRRFRPELWAKVVPELDRAASAVAKQQAGTVVDPQTVTVGGQRARRYDVRYDGAGRKLTERITFVLREKVEYLLLCRYDRGGPADVCELLLRSFRLAAA